MTARECVVRVRHALVAGVPVEDDAGVGVSEFQAVPHEPLAVRLVLTNDGDEEVGITLRLIGLGTDIEARAIGDWPPGVGRRDTEILDAEFNLPDRLRPGVNDAVIEWVDTATNARLAVAPITVMVDNAADIRIKLERPAAGLLGDDVTVILENAGNRPITLNLRAEKPDKHLHIEFTPRRVELCALATCEAIATIRRRPQWFGASRHHVFDIQAVSSSGMRTASGSFRQHSVFPPLLFKFTAAVLMLVAALAGLRAAVHLVTRDTAHQGWVTLAAPDKVISARTGHTATWVQFTRPDRPQGLASAATRAGDWITGATRDEVGVIIWGGLDSARATRADGAFYSVTHDTWSSIASLPDDQARSGQQAIWTGERLVIWGGVNTTAPAAAAVRALAEQSADAQPAASAADSFYGAQYDPVTNRWEPLPDSGLEPRTGYSMLWTGKELIVFGGITADGRVLGDGGILRAGRVTGDGATTAASYGDLSHGIWSRFEAGDLAQPDAGPFSSAARAFHAAGWDGRYMVISGGMSPDGTLLTDAYAYHVAINRWDLIRDPLAQPRACHQAITTDTGMALIGGIGVGDVDGPVVPPAQRITVSAGQVDTLCSIPRSTDRRDPGSSIVTLAPNDANASVPDFVWAPLAGAPEHLGSDFRATWTGTAIGIVVPAPALDSVAVIRYQPDEQTDLEPLPSPRQLGFRSQMTAAWSGNRVLVWGGRGEAPCDSDAQAADNGGCVQSDGARLDVAP